jgi:hypothetical protein
MIISIPRPTVDGIPTSVDEAVLADPTETFGIRRVDTEQVIVADGTALTLNGENYEYDFSAAIEGVEYEAYFRLSYDGDVYHYQDFFTAEGAYTHTIKAVFVDEDGALFELSSVPVLSSPSGSYGVKSLDTGLTVVAAGTTMSVVGAGHYVAAFSVEEENLRYRFYVWATIDYVDYYLPSVTTGRLGSVALALGRYTNSYLVGQMVGHDNLYLWAGTPQYGTAEGDEPLDFAIRISQFIRDAEEWLDGELLGAYISEAFEAPIPYIIRRIATTMAAVMAYESRGVDDVPDGSEGPVHRLSGAKKQALKDIRRIKMGLISLTDTGYGPVVGVTDETEND